MVARSGYVPIPRSTTDYVELLPAEWRRINEEGVTFNNRVYDTADLNPYRRADSGVTAQSGRWELHHDPYDITQIWIRNHHCGGWITATWVHRDLVRQPFSAAIYDHVRARSAAAGEPVRDDYIARRVAEMLDPERLAGQSRADQRMVARERNNPPRPAPSGLAEPELTADDLVVPAIDPPMDPNEEPASTGSGSPISRRTRKSSAVAGFGVFDPTSDDWEFR